MLTMAYFKSMKTFNDLLINTINKFKENVHINYKIEQNSQWKKYFRLEGVKKNVEVLSKNNI